MPISSEIHIFDFWETRKLEFPLLYSITQLIYEVLSWTHYFIPVRKKKHFWIEFQTLIRVQWMWKIPTIRKQIQRARTNLCEFWARLKRLPNSDLIWCEFFPSALCHWKLTHQNKFSPLRSTSISLSSVIKSASSSKSEDGTGFWCDEAASWAWNSSRAYKFHDKQINKKIKK